MTHALSAVVLCAALVALVASTLERRRRGAFPLGVLLAEWFGPCRPRVIALAALPGVVSVAAPLAAAAALGWGRLAPAAGVTGRWIVLALASVALKAAWAAVEETIFRGAVLEQVSRRAGVAVGLAVSAGLFALSHVSRSPSPDGLSLAVLALDGLGFGIALLVTGSLWAPTAWHAAKNATVWAALGAGTLQFTLGPCRIEVNGPVFWTGAPGQAGVLDLLATATAVAAAGLLLARRGPRRDILAGQR